MATKAPTLIDRFWLFMARLFPPKPTREVRVTVTGPVERRIRFALAMGWEPDVFLLWGDSTAEQDVYLAPNDGLAGWIFALGKDLDLKIEITEVAT